MNGKAACAWGGSFTIVLLAVVGGDHYARHHGNPRRAPLHHCPMTRVDGRYYLGVAANGYARGDSASPTIAFFPLYPLAIAAITRATGLAAEAAALALSNLALLAAFLLVARRPPEPSGRDRNASYAMTALAVWPLTFFFRMAYTESILVGLELLLIMGLRNGWRVWQIALVAALACAARPTGVALLVPFAWHLWITSRGPKRGFARLVLWLPVAASGLVAFMAYQYVWFGDATAFLKAQEYWTMRATPPFWRHLEALLTLEPVWDVYDRGSRAYWRWNADIGFPLASLNFMNPVFFLGTALMIVHGAYRRWLSTPEVLLAAALLFIPWVTHSYRSGMMAHGRYAAVAYPAYVVLGEYLARAPPTIRWALVTLSAGWMACYAALFAAGFRLV
jgi:hypothetical protein